MKNVLITGAKGFIGKNLIVWFNSLNDINVFEYDIESTLEQLSEYVSEADFVFHLAGVNRPDDPKDFIKGNTNFTALLINTLENNNRNIPILMTSSTQAEKNNPYGNSKKAAEELLFEYREKGGKVYIYRLPNVFGKWCKPNYNSVVATFCYNLTRNLEITISDRSNALELVYIDDVVEEFYHVMNEGKSKILDYYNIPVSYKITLGKLVDTLSIINKNRETLTVPDLSNGFIRKLYATYLTYLPENDFSYDLKLFSDERGDLFELIKSDCFGQIFISNTKPGITRGNHYHRSKFEKFCVLRGKAEIKFRNIITKEKMIYKVSGIKPRVVDIPPGYTHSITNIGENELVTLFWANEIFNHDKPDTYFDKLEK